MPRVFKTVLLTGCCGFIGSNFVNYMSTRYPETKFINVDCLNYCADTHNVLPDVRNSDNYIFVKGNICSYDLMSYLITEHQPDAIIHFAAQSHVDGSFLEPLRYTKDNVEGTHTLLEAARNNKPDLLFVHISTDEVYGETDSKKDEQEILCPTNPYAASKACAEMLVNAYKYSFGMRTIITRGNNVYGPNQYPEKLIPKFMKALQEGKKCTIHGTGETIRSFLHVFDVIRAIDVIAHHGEEGHIYNIGGDDDFEFSVNQVTKMLFEEIILPNNPEARLEDWITHVADRPFNDKRYWISNLKLRALGWEPTISLRQGIKGLVMGIKDPYHPFFTSNL